MDHLEWIQKQWVGSDFGDKRLVKRAIKIAHQSLKHSDKNLPGRFQDWAGLKGAYRFFSSDKVTHHKVQSIHNENVIKESRTSKDLVIFIQDGSELLYNNHMYTTGLGPTCDSNGNGIMMHSCLAVKLSEEMQTDMLGLANQEVWIRDKKEKATEKESKVWLESIRKIGSPPSDANWVTVGDRANDIYEFNREAKELGWDYVVRVKHDRGLLIDGEKKKLKSWILTLPVMAQKELSLRTRGDKQGRNWQLQIRWSKASVSPPQKFKKEDRLEITYVSVSCPEGDLDWLLATNLEVADIQDVLRVIKIYEKRWIIEEYHKCLKSGCKIEEAQLQRGKRLLVLLGVLGVVATQLLKLRDISRSTPDEPATNIVPVEYVELVKIRFKIQGELTLYQFWRRVAQLGGFIGRKSDGEPGWQTLWSGWQQLQSMVQGFLIHKMTYG